MAKPCNRCGAEIGWKEEGGKWIPLNPDGSEHRTTCTGSKSSGGSDSSAVLAEVQALRKDIAEIKQLIYDYMFSTEKDKEEVESNIDEERVIN